MSNNRSVSVFQTPSGDRMAVLPIAEYERLLAAADDLGDIAAYDKVKAEIASGSDELVPAEFAERLIAGENPVRVWREMRGRAAKDLAEESGISVAYLNQIETGKRAGTVDVLKKLAGVLGITIDDLV